MCKILEKMMKCTIGNHQHTLPVLDLKMFYTGKLEAHGVARDIFGRIKRRFVAKVKGQQEGERLILNEDFTYDDGRIFKRQWDLTQKNQEGTIFQGRGADIFGEIQAETSGAAGLLRYTLKIPAKGSKRGFKTMKVIHWQYLVDATHTLHFLTFKRFGIPVLKSTVMFHRID